MFFFLLSFLVHVGELNIVFCYILFIFSNSCRFFKPKPEFSYFDEADGTVCQIVLPSNAPTRQVLGAPQSSKDEAKRDACLEACKLLHELGALTDFLLPELDDNEDVESSSDSDCSDG